MKLRFLCAVLFLCAIICDPAHPVTFSGKNLPYDSTFHLGVVTGPGAGVDIGADMFYPLEWIKIGGDIEQQVTNSNFTQNINPLKYGIAIKYDITDIFYVTLHAGGAQFYVAKEINYTDSFNGTEYTIGEDTHGHATYWGVSPCFRVGEYIIMPKFVVNSIADGGNIFELDLNIGHKF